MPFSELAPCPDKMLARTLMDQSDKAYLPYKSDCHDIGGDRVFNATFNNISSISWWSVLLVEETGVPGENHRPVTNH